MNVHRHAEKSMVALSGKLPVPASVLIARLRQMEAPVEDTALEVCRMTMAHGPVHEETGTNGDSLVVIIRGGNVLTAMLRRSWNQPFTPDALRVARVATW